MLGARKRISCQYRHKYLTHQFQVRPTQLPERRWCMRVPQERGGGVASAPMRAAILGSKRVLASISPRDRGAHT